MAKQLDDEPDPYIPEFVFSVRQVPWPWPGGKRYQAVCWLGKWEVFTTPGLYNSAGEALREAEEQLVIRLAQVLR